MAQSYKIAILVGSLRSGSLNKKLAETLIQLAPEALKFKFVEIGDLPFYNSDLEEINRPESWNRFRDDIASSDGILFVTPEYNRSIPAALKNAIDVGSRPMGKSAFKGKPAAIMTGSPGSVGGFGANHHLRQPLVFLDMPTMQQPEAYIGGLMGLFDDEGHIKNKDSQKFLKNFIDSFASWVEKYHS